MYYGHSGTLPLVNYDSQFQKIPLWLPQPFALLDMPIPHNIGDLIISRFVHTHQADGYIVLDLKGHNADFFKIWLDRISKYYVCKNIDENIDYRIYACSYIKN